MLLEKNKNFTKRLIIIEGADASGKSTLLKNIMDDAEGKCHVFHSNYSKDVPNINHRRQHKLITKSILKLFNDKYYTGNHTIILDRCYISDIIYGSELGYGSRGSVKSKFKFLNKLFKKVLKKKIPITIVYCRPKKSLFNENNKQELVSRKENKLIQSAYDSFFRSFELYVKVKYDANCIEYENVPIYEIGSLYLYNISKTKI